MNYNFQSNIFLNTIVHKRFFPFKHNFKYYFFSLFIDYKEIKKLDKYIYFFSYNKFNLFSFYDKDHGNRNGKPINNFVKKILQKNKIKFNNLNIKILCFPRILGYVFNPVSVIFCYRGNKLIAILYEVKNTSLEQHTYCFVGKKYEVKKVYKHSCKKIFYVSPFIQMKCRYKFSIKEPKDTLLFYIEQYNDKNKKILLASQIGNKINLNSQILLKMFFKFPLMTFKIILAIHFEAIKIFFKGGKYYSRNRKVIDTVSYEGSL